MKTKMKNQFQAFQVPLPLFEKVESKTLPYSKEVNEFVYKNKYRLYRYYSYLNSVKNDDEVVFISSKTDKVIYMRGRLNGKPTYLGKYFKDILLDEGYLMDHANYRVNYKCSEYIIKSDFPMKHVGIKRQHDPKFYDNIVNEIDLRSLDKVTRQQKKDFDKHMTFSLEKASRYIVNKAKAMGYDISHLVTSDLTECFDAISEYMFNAAKENGFKNNENTKYKQRNPVKVINKWIVTIQNILNNSYKFSRGEKSYRVYNPLVKTAKELREAFYHDEEKLVEFDASNSQVFLALYVMLDLGFEIEEDLKESIIDGKFYELLVNGIGNVDRNDAKNSTFKYILFTNFNLPEEYNGKEEFLKFIYENYPKFYAALRFCKRNFQNELHNNFATYLQKLESSIWVNTIARRLQERNIFVLTIHDAIQVKESDRFIALETVYSAFKEITVMVPNVK